MIFCSALSGQLCKAGNVGSRCPLSYEKAIWLYLEGKAGQVRGIRTVWAQILVIMTPIVITLIITQQGLFLSTVFGKLP